LSRCQKKSCSGLYGSREDKGGRHTDHPDGCHSIRTNQRLTSIIPPFIHRMPFLPQPSTLSWLGTGTKLKYAGLHIQWCGCLHTQCRGFIRYSNKITDCWLSKIQLFNNTTHQPSINNSDVKVKSHRAHTQYRINA